MSVKCHGIKTFVIGKEQRSLTLLPKLFGIILMLYSLGPQVLDLLTVVVESTLIYLQQFYRLSLLSWGLIPTQTSARQDLGNKDTQPQPWRGMVLCLYTITFQWAFLYRPHRSIGFFRETLQCYFKSVLHKHGYLVDLPQY